MIYSPLEQFEVFELIGIHTFLGYTFALTNFGFYVCLTVVVLLGLNGFSHVNTHNVTIVIPTRWGIAMEIATASFNHLVKEQIGSKAEVYLPFVYAMFWVVLIGNLISNVPYNYSIATSLLFSLGLSFAMWFSNTILAVNKHGVKFLMNFLPAGTPTVLIPLLYVIELISYASRAISLGVRLIANLVSGHTLLGILSGMIYKVIGIGKVAFIMSVLPLTIFVALIGLELCVSFIQAFVWVTLLSGYIRDAEYLH